MNERDLQQDRILKAADAGPQPAKKTSKPKGAGSAARAARSRPAAGAASQPAKKPAQGRHAAKPAAQPGDEAPQGRHAANAAARSGEKSSQGRHAARSAAQSGEKSAQGRHSSRSAQRSGSGAAHSRRASGAPSKETASDRGKARRRSHSKLRPYLNPLFGVLLLCCLCFSAVNLHPTMATSASKAAAQRAAERAARAAAATPTPTPMPTPEPEETAAQEPEAEAEPVVTPEPTPEPTPAPVHYTIPEEALAAQMPQIENSGEVANEDAYQVLDVIQQARDIGLLGEDETVIFDPEVKFYNGQHAKKIQYYLDETIMMILWKEEIDGWCVTFAEVKIADASQFRRKLAGDSFGSNTQYYCSELARSANAVVAMNADYYAFRDLGIVVYNRNLYRLNTERYNDMYKYNCIDTMFVTAQGDLLYKRIGEERTVKELEMFIEDNDIVFSLAFGPVLVEDGKALQYEDYPLGQVNGIFSRAGIGQVDTLHYLYMALNHSPEKEARWTVNTFAKNFAKKDVQTAYCLDGGQTGEVVYKGKPYNYIDFGNERLVSDIIYFGTALPPSEGGGTE